MASARTKIPRYARDDKRLCCSSRSLLLQSNRQSIANRQNGRIEILGVVKQPIELENGLLRVFRILVRDLSAPKNIVRDKQATLAQAWRHQTQHTRVVLFIDIVEDDVILLLLLR